MNVSLFFFRPAPPARALPTPFFMLRPLATAHFGGALAGASSPRFYPVSSPFSAIGGRFLAHAFVPRSVIGGTVFAISRIVFRLALGSFFVSFGAGFFVVSGDGVFLGARIMGKGLDAVGRRWTLGGGEPGK